jgi:hypothetical protein
MTRTAFSSFVFVAVLPAIVCFGWAPLPQGGATIRLDATKRFQTIVGWEAVSWIGQASPKYQEWRQEALELAVNDLGINRLRLEVPSGLEHATDIFALEDTLSEDEFGCLRYSTVNDNDDPNDINPAGFQFSSFDKNVEEVVLPIRQLLQARGETLHLNICYVAFTHVLSRPPCDGSLLYHHRDAAEYAEFVLAVSKHLRDKYGLEADTWEFLLEPDNNTGWTGTPMGQAIAAAGPRLRDAGFSTTFVVPSVKNMVNAARFFDEILAVPGAIGYVSEISYHRYGGAHEPNFGNVRQRAAQHNLRTAMLEHIGSGYEDLHTDLKEVNVSSWEQYTICGPAPGDPGGRYYLVDATKPPGQQLRIASRTPPLRQYFRYIRKGAVRIGADGGTPTFDPLAFVNRNGGYVVVVKAAAGGTIGVTGLPEGAYGITYTTATEFLRELPDVVVGPGQALQTSIPAKGAITIFAKGEASDRATITDCRVKQSASGARFVVVTGENLKAGATAIVGGIVPRKIKFKGEVSPGSGVYTQMILKKGVCAGLPGDVVVTNPGADPSIPFTCQDSCP